MLVTGIRKFSAKDRYTANKDALFQAFVYLALFSIALFCLLFFFTNVHYKIKVVIIMLCAVFMLSVVGKVGEIFSKRREYLARCPKCHKTVPVANRLFFECGGCGLVMLAACNPQDPRVTDREKLMQTTLAAMLSEHSGLFYSLLWTTPEYFVIFREAGGGLRERILSARDREIGEKEFAEQFKQDIFVPEFDWPNIIAGLSKRKRPVLVINTLILLGLVLLIGLPYVSILVFSSIFNTLMNPMNWYYAAPIGFITGIALFWVYVKIACYDSSPDAIELSDDGTAVLYSEPRQR